MIKKKSFKILFGIVSIVSSAFILQCSGSDRLKNSETFAEVVGEIETFASNKYKKYTSVTKEFNLGKKNFENMIDIDMKGLISYPKEKKEAPILIILAGNENLIREENVLSKDLYKGYRYLADALAECGFLTVVIDTQFKDGYFNDEVVEDKILEELFDYHVENLTDAVLNGSNVYGISLQNKGDINNIGLIGQSSTARNIFNICDRKYQSNDFKIKGLLSITPGESLSIANSYPDVPTSILVAEHSVNTKIGFDMYNEIEKQINRKHMANLTYIIGGDSRRFNERIEEDKILEAKVDEIHQISERRNIGQRSLGLELANALGSRQSLEQDSEDVLSQEKMLMKENTDLVVDTSLHENFLSSYCASFFKTIFNEDEDFENIVSGLRPAPSKLYGMKVLNKYYNKDKEVLYSSNSTSKLRRFKIGVEDVIESSVKDIDEAINFNEPTTVSELKLKKLTWDSKNPFVKIPLKGVDLSKHNALNFRWAIDSSSLLNVISQKVATITVEDINGDKSSVTLGSENALRKIEGKEKVFGNGSMNWSRYTPLSDTRVPISVFKNIDIENIKNISISFDNSSSGSIYLESISLIS